MKLNARKLEVNKIVKVGWVKNNDPIAKNETNTVKT